MGFSSRSSCTSRQIFSEFRPGAHREGSDPNRDRKGADIPSLVPMVIGIRHSGFVIH